LIDCLLAPFSPLPGESGSKTEVEAVFLYFSVLSSLESALGKGTSLEVLSEIMLWTGLRENPLKSLR
jgi:hypothetical protein